jgi:predicted alpha/beta superfamily hydrolase
MVIDEAEEEKQEKGRGKKYLALIQVKVVSPLMSQSYRTIPVI